MASAADIGLIDAHVHIWDRSRFHYHWLTPGSPLDRIFSLNDYAADMDALKVQGGILLEATNTPEEIAWLLAAAEESPLEWGVVGWIDLDQASALAEIERWAQHPRFKGVRLNWLTPRADPERLYPALAALKRHGLVVEVLAHPDQLPQITGLTRLFPALTFVLNHFGGWALTHNRVDQWKWQMHVSSRLPNTVLKISGFAGADVVTLRAYIQAADALFGPQRLVVGSNMPFCPHGYDTAIRLLTEACAEQSTAWQHAVFRENAQFIYTLNGVSS